LNSSKEFSQKYFGNFLKETKMLRFKILLVIILMNVLLIGCSKNKEIELIPNSTQVTGDLESYITVVDGTYKVENISSDLILMIKIKIEKKIEEGREFEEINAQIIDDKGMPLTGVGKFFIAKGLWASSDDNTKVDQSLLKGSGEVIVQLQYSDFGMLSREEAIKIINEKGKKFIINTKTKLAENLSMIQNENQNDKEIAYPDFSDNESQNLLDNDNSTSSSDCDQFIKDYEKFADSYIKILKKYKNNPSDMSILKEYTDCMQEAKDMQTKAQDCNDPKYATKLKNIATKIAEALQ
jgi:hypothetical protein